ncbi:embryonic polarity protein dorsal isoform X1 [Fopius arisanus]|uniref:Embryonic polarity protein dorsal isoform X1 n=1 Tax=Fopius arisanus TaxID=64838 RepID=A0A9R1TE15_9HYME|nr:PREDICTED: embryonic polarity protein dorsal-like isoform X1 [Fopius arisanus]
MEVAAQRNPPYIEIIEQPAPRAVRFRYQSEGRPSGNLIGLNSTKERTTYPKIRVTGLRTIAYVVVSCVTKDKPYRIHPHSLINGEPENNCQKMYPGIINAPVDPNHPEVTFTTVKLQCVPREDAKRALMSRVTFPMNPFPCPGWEDSDIGAIDLNAVRLCFQVFTEHPETRKPQAVCLAVSEPIFDKKRFNVLEICRLTTHTASMAGGTELTMLCKKVAKSDIQVRFYEEKGGRVVWQAFADPKYLHFFKQISIKLRTPAYHDVDFPRPVPILMQLVRPSDGDVSEAVPFQLEPCNKEMSPRKQNPSAMNLLRRNNCDCIPHPIFQPDCEIHGGKKENEINNMINVELPEVQNVPLMSEPEDPMYPNFNSMSNLKNDNFYRKFENFPAPYYAPQKILEPLAPLEFETPEQEGMHSGILMKPLIKSLRRNFSNSDLIMREINSEEIEEVDSDTVYNNLPIFEQF